MTLADVPLNKSLSPHGHRKCDVPGLCETTMFIPPLCLTKICSVGVLSSENGKDRDARGSNRGVKVSFMFGWLVCPGSMQVQVWKSTVEIPPFRRHFADTAGLPSV